MSIQWRAESKRYVVRGFAAGSEAVSRSFSIKQFDGSKRRALSAAKAYEADLARMACEGRPIAEISRSTTVSELAETYWLERLRSKARSTYDNSLSDRRANIKPVFGDQRITSLRRLTIQRWQNDIGRRDASNPSAQISLENLRRILHEAVKLGLIAENPAIGVEPVVGIERDRRFLTFDQVVRLADAVGAKARPLVLLAGLAGQRWGEIAGASLHEWDGPRRRLHLTRQLYDKRPPAELVPLKSKQARWIGVPELAAEALDEMVRGRRDIDGPLFPAAVRDGLGVGYLRHSNFIRRTFHPAVEDLSRTDSAFHRLRYHDLRHSAASIWIQRGAPATVVAAQLGHSTPAFTLRTYAHLYEEDVASAAARIL